jgi:hypothetical protein
LIQQFRNKAALSREESIRRIEQARTGFEKAIQYHITRLADVFMMPYV